MQRNGQVQNPRSGHDYRRPPKRALSPWKQDDAELNTEERIDVVAQACFHDKTIGHGPYIGVPVYADGKRRGSVGPQGVAVQPRQKGPRLSAQEHQSAEQHERLHNPMPNQLQSGDFVQLFPIHGKQAPDEIGAHCIQSALLMTAL